MSLDDDLMGNTTPDTSGKRTVWRWTYFVQGVEGGPVKIGRTTFDNPWNRVAILQPSSPLVLRIVGLLKGDREAEMHSKFAASRLHNEQFAVTAELVEFCAGEPSEVLGRVIPIVLRLQLEGTAIPVSDVTVPTLGISFFAELWHNDEDLWELPERYWDLEEDADDDVPDEDALDSWIDENGDVSDDPDWYGNDDAFFDHEQNIIWSMVESVRGNSFVEAIGINPDCGHFGFICGPCNSGLRRAILKELGCLADYMDGLTRQWFFFAVMFNRGKQIGVDLRKFSLGIKDYIFDPSAWQASDLAGDDIAADGSYAPISAEMERAFQEAISREMTG